MMKSVTRASLATSVAVLATASLASAAARDTFTWTTPFSPSQNSLSSAGLIVAPDTVANTGGAYTLQRILVSGTIQEINGTTGDFVSDNEIHISIPGYSAFSFDLSSTSSYTGTVNFTGTYFPTSTITSPWAGTPTFRFANTFDDSPTGGVLDAQISNLTVTFRDDLPSPSGSITDLGKIGNVSDTYSVADYTRTVTTSSSNPVAWIKFEIPTGGMLSSLDQFLDIDTSGGDSVIGLYRAFGAGLLEDSDDDDGPGSGSALSYGDSSPARGPIGDAVAGNARDGSSLGAGVYYLAVAGYTGSWSMTTGYNVTGVSTLPNTFTVNLRTNLPAIPEPATLGLLAGLGVLALRRR